MIMNKIFLDYLDCLTALHDGLKRAIEGLPQDALDWVPGSDMNSLGVLIVHVTGSQRYWTGDIVAQESSGRDRDAEFRARNVEADELAERLDNSLVYVRSVLERIALEDLGASRVAPQFDREVTAGWALFHVLEHTALHLGHAQVTRQAWEQRPGI